MKRLAVSFSSSRLCRLLCAVSITLFVHSVAYAGTWIPVDDSEIASTTSAAAISAPQGNGMPYNSSTATAVASARTFTWDPDPNIQNDVPGPAYAVQQLSCSTGTLSANGTPGTARARADFHYYPGIDYSFIYKENGTLTGSQYANSPVTHTSSTLSYPTQQPDGSWKLDLTTASFFVVNSCQVDPAGQPHTLTASAAISTMTTVAQTVRPDRNF